MKVEIKHRILVYDSSGEWAYGSCKYDGKDLWFIAEVRPYQSFTIYDSDTILAMNGQYIDAQWQEEHLVDYMPQEYAIRLAKKLIERN